jgi:hypothetical protein
MKLKFFNLFILCLVTAFRLVSAQTNPDYWQFASKPPLGWNSWDIFGTTVTEQQVKEQADAMAINLLPRCITMIQMLPLPWINMAD